MITACHKEKKVVGCTDPAASNYNSYANTNDGTCQYCPIPLGTCVGFFDTALAYQQILGKWYLRVINVSYPNNNDNYCYADSQTYLGFLPNRLVNIHDSFGTVRTIPYEFTYNDSLSIYNKFRILDSLSPQQSAEFVQVCDSSFRILRYDLPWTYLLYYVKEW